MQIVTPIVEPMMPSTLSMFGSIRPTTNDTPTIPNVSTLNLPSGTWEDATS